MLYDLSDQLQAENFKRRCNLLYRKRTVVSLTEKKQRTLRQNAYLHAALAYFGLQFGYTVDEVKRWYFKTECNRELFVREITDPLTGENRIRLRSSSDLTKEEMSLALERFRNWASLKGGVYIPTPEEHEMVAQMEMEVERGKLYL